MGFHHMAMDQYLYIPFLGGWTSIYFPAILMFTKGVQGGFSLDFDGFWHTKTIFDSCHGPARPSHPWPKYAQQHTVISKGAQVLASLDLILPRPWGLVPQRANAARNAADHRHFNSRHGSFSVPIFHITQPRKVYGYVWKWGIPPMK